MIKNKKTFDDNAIQTKKWSTKCYKAELVKNQKRNKDKSTPLFERRPLVSIAP